VGDLLVTSGLGGRFPHGYPVARITDVTISPGDAFAQVNAAPSSALDRGRFVLVVVRESADSIQPGSQL
jgi:rod shape-determining protein MreC